MLNIGCFKNPVTSEFWIFWLRCLALCVLGPIIKIISPLLGKKKKRRSCVLETKNVEKKQQNKPNIGLESEEANATQRRNVESDSSGNGDCSSHEFFHFFFFV